METGTLITEEARALIGKEEKPIVREVYEKEIRRFCFAVGDLNSLYLDEAVAKKSKYGGIVAPPMFYDIPTMPEFPLEELKEDGMPKAIFNLPLKAKRAMAGGKEVEFFQPMRQGDIITQVRKLVELYEKKGSSGPLVFAVFESSFINQDGELVAIEKFTAIFW